MKKLIITFLFSVIMTNTHAELVLVSGKAKQKNYIDTASILIQNNAKAVTYNQLIFFDQNFEIERYRNSVAVQTNIMDCGNKTWAILSVVRKSSDQRRVIEILQDRPSSITAKPIVNSGPVKFVYDNYCR